MTAINRFPSQRRRQGFTLVEVLVAMALIIFIMVILTEAFSAGIGTFRALKAQGDMQAKMRTAESLIRDDLVRWHFDGNQTLSTLGLTPSPPAPTPPTQGYFFIKQWGSIAEGLDSTYSVPSFRMWSPGDTPPAPDTPFMCFTVNLGQTAPPPPPAAGDTFFLPSDFIPARIPPTTPPGTFPAEAGLTSSGPAGYRQNNAFISQWAEVGYFLADTGNFAGTDAANRVKLWSLRRRTRTIVPPPLPGATPLAGSAGSLNTSPPAGRIPVSEYNSRYAEMSCIPDLTTGFIYFNDPIDLRTDANLNRMYEQTTPAFQWNTKLGTLQGQPTWAGDDLVLTDVISFNVRVLFKSAAAAATPPPVDFQDPDPLPGATGAPFVYDSGTSTSATPTKQLVALEITIRVWDVKTNLARQVTIVQDM